MSNRFFQHSLNPSRNQDVNHIVTLNPAQSDGLIKSLNTILSYCNPTRIFIVNSRIAYWYKDSAGIISIDLRELLNTDISLALINHRSLPKKFQSVNNGSNLTITSVCSGQFYRFVAGTSEIDIPAVPMEFSESPTFNLYRAVELGAKIQIDDTTLLASKARSGSVKIQTIANQMSSVCFNDGSAYQFSRLALCECPSPSDRIFLSFAFLRCAGKKAEMKLVKNADDHFLITDSAIGVGIQARTIDCLYNFSCSLPTQML